MHILRKSLFHFIQRHKHDVHRMMHIACESTLLIRQSGLNAGERFRGCACFMARLKTGRLTFDLQGVQKAVDAADQLLPLARQGFIRFDVGVLLHLSGHQPLGLLTGPAHQILQMAVQLLYLADLQTEKRKRLERVWKCGKRQAFDAIDYLFGQIGALRFEAGL